MCNEGSARPAGFGLQDEANEMGGRRCARHGRFLANYWVYILILALAGGGAERAFAGGGRTCFWWSIRNDPSSPKIANAYAALRDIPSNNILFLAHPPDYQNKASHFTGGGYKLLPYANRQRHRVPRADKPDRLHWHNRPSNLLFDHGGGVHARYDRQFIELRADLLTPLTDGSGLTFQGDVSEQCGPDMGTLREPR